MRSTSIEPRGKEFCFTFDTEISPIDLFLLVPFEFCSSCAKVSLRYFEELCRERNHETTSSHSKTVRSNSFPLDSASYFFQTQQMRMNVEFVEKNRSAETMDHHGDLTVLVERRFQKSFDVLKEEKKILRVKKRKTSFYFSIGNHVDVAQFIEMRVGRTKTKPKQSFSIGEVRRGKVTWRKYRRDVRLAEANRKVKRQRCCLASVARPDLFESEINKNRPGETNAPVSLSKNVHFSSGNVDEALTETKLDEFGSAMVSRSRASSNSNGNDVTCEKRQWTSQ